MQRLLTIHTNHVVLQDDYGAPFVVNNKMYGMFVGFLYDCTANPRVYVKMSSIADWVNETISEK